MSRRLVDDVGADPRWVEVFGVPSGATIGFWGGGRIRIRPGWSPYINSDRTGHWVERTSKGNRRAVTHIYDENA